MLHKEQYKNGYKKLKEFCEHVYWQNVLTSNESETATNIFLETLKTAIDISLVTITNNKNTRK